MAERTTLFVPPEPSGDEEEAQARELARRYRREFVDLHGFHIHHDLLRKVPVDLMFRYNFIPLEDLDDGTLVIAIDDPKKIMMIDEISLRLNRQIRTKIAT